VRWSNHASADREARLDEGFARRVDAVVDRLLANGAWVILDLHHYTQLTGGAAATRHPREFAVEEAVVEQRLVNLWRQIAARYRGRSSKLLFELLNEPQGTGADAALGCERWNRLAARALAAVRETNPTRVVLIGPDDWNHPRGLARLRLPADRNLIVTFHSYDPFEFTHQGVPWRQPVLPKGLRCCDEAQRQQLREALDNASAWSRAQGVPLFLGEFGAYREAPMASRAAYAQMVREEAEARGIGWAWWEFASDFSPVWDAAKQQWVEPIRQALGIATDR
jgi:endoglucanase